MDQQLLLATYLQSVPEWAANIGLVMIGLMGTAAIIFGGWALKQIVQAHKDSAITASSLASVQRSLDRLDQTLADSIKAMGREMGTIRTVCEELEKIVRAIEQLTHQLEVRQLEVEHRLGDLEKGKQ